MKPRPFKLLKMAWPKNKAGSRIKNEQTGPPYGVAFFVENHTFIVSMAKYILLLVVGILMVPMVKAQYVANGSATQNNCNCYTLTQNVGSQFGAVWNTNQINLNQSFDFSFQVFLGCTDINGADGIAFVLQNTSTTIGTTGTGGGSMGYLGINPAVGVTLDTYQNGTPDNDPSYDHISIQLNGNTSHTAATCLTPNTPISASSNNVEDCQNHTLRIRWNATTKVIDVFFDGVLRLSIVNDFVNTVFGGNPLVFWGFTGATGGLSNLQQFCTTLNPNFYFLPGQAKCVNEPITFNDSTVSFAEPVIRVWNFGDGSPTITNVVNPVHTYTTPGNYTVVLTVTGPDGCQAVFNQPIVVGSKPIAGFSYSGSCVNNTIQFTDTSDVAVGTINQWYWDFDNNGLTSTFQNPATIYTTPGIKNIRFLVKTAEGCVSDTLIQPITISARPTVDFTFTDSVCIGTPTFFQDQSSAGGSVVNYWQWTYDDSTGTATLQNPSHIFSTAGNHTVTLVSSTSGSNACAGTAVSQTVYVSSKPTAGIRWDTLCERQPVRLQDASTSPGGEAITSCWWDLGNGQFSNQCNPTVVYPVAGPRTIRHVVTNARGCVSDTFSVTINIADKPRIDFNFPNPVCNDSSLVFTDASTVGNGSVSAWNWIYNNASFGSTATVSGTFPFGNNQVGLSVSSSLGCFTDTLFKSFRLIRNPRIRMQFNDTCRYAPASFSASEWSPAIGIQSWNWSFGDGQSATANPTTHAYTNNGAYTVSLYAISTEGCRSETIRDQVNIYGTNAFAGNDTIAAANQPIQLLASGGVSYEWTPSTGLNNPTIRNPIATVTQDITYYLKAYTPAGCVSYDTMKIIIYAGPEIYVPTAFTPNGDGLNDQLAVLPIGLRSFDYFSVYNRYGQLVFTTNNKNQKWDGRYKGYRQASSAYVWVASGTDFRNKPVIRKGTVLLLY